MVGSSAASPRSLCRLDTPDRAVALDIFLTPLVGFHYPAVAHLQDGESNLEGPLILSVSPTSLAGFCRRCAGPVGPLFRPPRSSPLDGSNIRRTRVESRER